MLKSLGEMLDTPGDYSLWLQHLTAAFSVIFAVDRLGLLDHVETGPATFAGIAEASGCPESTVARLLGFLAAEGALEIDAEGCVVATERTRAMRATQQQRIGAMTLATGIALPDSVGSGTTAFEAHYGLPVFDYFAAHPEAGRMFGRIMSETTAANERFIFAHHPFHPFEVVVDVGGNHGSLLLRLLEAHPAASGVLFDLPGTVEQAAAPIAAAGMAGRVACVGGSFFDAVPPGGDLYLLKQILHDWSDDECRTILARVRAAMAEGTRLAVVERLLPEQYRPHNAYVVDVIMLLWTSGRERKLSEYVAMLEQAGFAFDRVTENPDGLSVVEAVAC